MKRTILTAALAACALSATAQIMEERNPVPMTPGGGRVYRTEVVPYDARHDAEARNREAGGYWKAFEPEVTIATEGPLHAVLEQEIEIPFAWTDGMVYLHVENPGSAYSLWLNDRQVAEVSDPLTPAEFDLTPFIREGANDFKLLMRNDNPARQHEYIRSNPDIVSHCDWQSNFQPLPSLFAVYCVSCCRKYTIPCFT